MKSMLGTLFHFALYHFHLPIFSCIYVSCIGVGNYFGTSSNSNSRNNQQDNTAADSISTAPDAPQSVSTSNSIITTSAVLARNTDFVESFTAAEIMDEKEEDDEEEEIGEDEDSLFENSEDDDEDEFTENDEDIDDEDDDNNGLTWVEWFCSLPGHDFYCIVDEYFIDDDFNMTGLPSIVPYYSEAMEMIQDIGPEGAYSKTDLQVIEASAEMLYSLIHQRFILSRQGSTALYEKFSSKVFGSCPRTLCEGQPVLPLGTSDIPNQDTVKLFCPRCLDLYNPQSSRHQTIDGCAFGSTASLLLLYSYPEINEQMKNEWWKRSVSEIYTPRIFGFKIHSSSASGSRMNWLRQKALQ